MNINLEAFLAIITLWGSGFFAFATVYGKTETHDQQGRVITKDTTRQYIYGTFSFITLLSGACLLLDALKLI